MTDDAACAEERIAAHFTAVARRMADLPICHPAIAVRVTAARRAGAFQLAVVTTPWSMLVVALPDDDGLLPRPGFPVVVPLPDGEMEASVAEAEGLGRYAVASLFSPMERFAGAADAFAVAEASLDQLLAPPPPAAPAALDRRSLLFGRHAEARP